MAEYCAQCAKQYGMSNGFINECKPNYLANVICEGCGVIQVNHKGECVSHDCDNGNHAVEWKIKNKKTVDLTALVSKKNINCSCLTGAYCH